MFNEDALDGPTADGHLTICHSHRPLHRGSHCLESCRRGGVQWGGQPPAHGCGETGHTGRSCPGAFGTHRWHERCGGYLCPLASSQSLPSPGALQHCEDGHQGPRHNTSEAAPSPISMLLWVSVPGLALCRGAGCAARALSRSSGAFLLPWGLCGAGAVGLGERRLPRRCRPSSTSARITGTGRGTCALAVTPAHCQPPGVPVPPDPHYLWGRCRGEAGAGSSAPGCSP